MNPIKLVGFVFEKNSPVRIMVLREDRFHFYAHTHERMCKLLDLTENCGWHASIREGNDFGNWTYKLRRYN